MLQHLVYLKPSQNRTLEFAKYLRIKIEFPIVDLHALLHLYTVNWLYHKIHKFP